MDHVIDILRELGPGFAFVDRQAHLHVSGDDRLRREVHANTIGILICGDKNDHTVRYSLGRAVSLTAALDRPSDETTPSAPDE